MSKGSGIATVDTFYKRSHGKQLVQHRYRAEQDTIFIIDECHEAISSKVKSEEVDGVKVENFSPRTKAFFNYGVNTISNILVSATPMLSENPFAQVRTVAKFLNREKKFYGIGHGHGNSLEGKCEGKVKVFGDKEVDEEELARRYVNYREVIDSLKGKITRVQYINDIEFRS